MFWRLTPRLNETHANGRIFREPRSDHRASRACTYDYEVKRLFLSHGRFLSSGVGSMDVAGVSPNQTPPRKGGHVG